MKVTKEIIKIDPKSKYVVTLKDGATIEDLERIKQYFLDFMKDKKRKFLIIGNFKIEKIK